MNATVREATYADADTVIALWQASELIRSWNDPQADYRRAIEWPGSSILVAEVDAELAGAAMVGFDGHRGWIYYLAVTPDWRGGGVGRALLERCQGWLRERGCPKVELMVRENNSATTFYEHLGWDIQDVRVFARWLEDKP